ncbi:Nop52-domain-containing protein [Gyrodon lividus]|nr:Nop52-domain-containing protein [Gyrodon lividus]
MATSSPPKVPPLGKYLASSEKKIRDKAVKNLAVFLSNDESNVMSDIEMAKLWKGIFYCFWMSDKPLVQQALAQELSELVLTITNVPSSLNFLTGFWVTTVREWNGIDRLRMDKYYMLVRRFVNASFRLLVQAKWDVSALREYNYILTSAGGPLCPNDVRVPASLTFHLAEIYLEELENALASSEPSLPVPLLALLSPFITLAAHTPTNTTYKHLQEALFQPLLTALQPRTSNPCKRARVSILEYPTILTNVCTYAPKMDPPLDAGALRETILQKLFAVASAQDTRDANRRKMYALYKSAVEDDEDSVG